MNAEVISVRILPHLSPMILQGVGAVLIVLGVLAAGLALTVPVSSRAPQPDRACGTTVTALRRHGGVLTISNDDAAEADFENGCRDAARQRLALAGGVSVVVVLAGVVLIRTAVPGDG